MIYRVGIAVVRKADQAGKNRTACLQTPFWPLRFPGNCKDKINSCSVSLAEDRKKRQVPRRSTTFISQSFGLFIFLDSSTGRSIMQQAEPELRWLNGLGGGAAIRLVRLNQQRTETEGAGEWWSPARGKRKQFQGASRGLGAKKGKRSCLPLREEPGTMG